MRYIFILLNLTVLLFDSSVFSQDIAKEIKFANELFESEEYYRAITEYLRINSYFPENPYFINNYKKIALCYSLSDHLIESNKFYYKILSINKDNWSSVLNIAKNYHNLSYYNESNTFMYKYINTFNPSKKDTLNYLSAINHIYLSEYENAKEKFSLIQTDKILMLQADLYEKIINEELPLSLKSKTKGTILNILIPGAGYIYSKHYQTGISAIFVHLLFGYATYNSFKNGNDGAGLTLGLITTSFYLGSIYGTLQSVYQYNNNNKRKFTDKFHF